MNIPDTKDCVSRHLGVYACRPEVLQQIHALAVAGKLPMKAEDDFDREREELKKPECKRYCVTGDGVAVVRVDGVMQKPVSKFDDGCSTLELRKAFRQIEKDDNARAWALVFDSPGGAVAGQTELLAALDKLKTAKPGCAIVEDMACSAAYWLAAAAGMVYATPLALVGNIGCYCVAADTTGALEREGVKLTTVTSGEYKGLGADGAVTPELTEELQRSVNDINKKFCADVSAARGLSTDEIAALDDGRAYSGDEALALKLVDKIASVEEAVADFTTTLNQKEERMEQSIKEAVSAFASMAREHGVEFAEANFGKSEGEVAAAVQAVELAKAVEEVATLRSELENAKTELADVQAALAAAVEERDAAKAALVPGADHAAGLNVAPVVEKKKLSYK